MAANKKDKKKEKSFSVFFFETENGGRIIAEAPKDEVDDFLKDCYPNVQLKRIS